MRTGAPRQSVAARFLSKVDQEGGPAACWPWTGARNPRGYGKFSLPGGKFIAAHRFSLATATGDEPRLVAMHRCDNPACVNPAHLIWGTVQDNQVDRVNKGTSNRKLTDAQLAEATRRHTAGEPKKAIAADLGVHAMTLHYAFTGRTYRAPARESLFR